MLFQFHLEIYSIVFLHAWTGIIIATWCVNSQKNPLKAYQLGRRSLICYGTSVLACRCSKERYGAIRAARKKPKINCFVQKKSKLENLYNIILSEIYTYFMYMLWKKHLAVGEWKVLLLCTLFCPRPFLLFSFFLFGFAIVVLVLLCLFFCLIVCCHEHILFL